MNGFGAMRRLDPNSTGSKANTYALGNRVYNGISTAPNTGATTNPSGYLERDKKASVKRNMLLQSVNRPTTGVFGGR